MQGAWNKSNCDNKQNISLLFSDDIAKLNDNTEGIWSDYEMACWLQVFDTETEYDRGTSELSRWKKFARRLREEFGVKRNNIQCQKQVRQILLKMKKIHSTCIK